MSFSVRKRRRWFLPEAPDVVGMLKAQADITAAGMNAFADWAGGDVGRAEDVRQAEHDCDGVRRQLVAAVSQAFTTPLEPEDLFQLSRDLDKVINGAKNTVREAEAMDFPPDRATAEMSIQLAEGSNTSERPSATWAPATPKIGSGGHRGRRRRGQVAAQPGADLSAGGVRSTQRHRYRRPDRAARALPPGLGNLDDIVSVADRIWYSWVKES